MMRGKSPRRFKTFSQGNTPATEFIEQYEPVEHFTLEAHVAVPACVGIFFGICLSPLASYFAQPFIGSWLLTFSTCFGLIASVVYGVVYRASTELCWKIHQVPVAPKIITPSPKPGTQLLQVIDQPHRHVAVDTPLPDLIAFVQAIKRGKNVGQREWRNYQWPVAGITEGDYYHIQVIGDLVKLGLWKESPKEKVKSRPTYELDHIIEALRYYQRHGISPLPSGTEAKTAA